MAGLGEGLKNAYGKCCAGPNDEQDIQSEEIEFGKHFVGNNFTGRPYLCS